MKTLDFSTRRLHRKTKKSIGSVTACGSTDAACTRSAAKPALNLWMSLVPGTGLDTLRNADFRLNLPFAGAIKLAA